VNAYVVDEYIVHYMITYWYVHYAHCAHWRLHLLTYPLRPTVLHIDTVCRLRWLRLEPLRHLKPRAFIRGLRDWHAVIIHSDEQGLEDEIQVQKVIYYGGWDPSAESDGSKQ
jgi:hypothetical protein